MKRLLAIVVAVLALREETMWKVFSIVVLAVASTTAVAAQEAPPDPAQTAQASTRQELIEQAQAAKVPTLHPTVPSKAEQLFQRLDNVLVGGTLAWHPFFENAYAGGGFTLGVGHSNYVSSYNYLDVRGSWTVKNYKRVEAEFVAPRLFDRRGHLSALVGWREATQVGFYGIGPDTSVDDRTNYLFNRPYASALLTVFPTRKLLMFEGGAELTQWTQEPGKGSFPPVETRYTPATLPGLNAQVTYLHTQGTLGFDWRTSPGYSRRGGYYGVTLHDYADGDDVFGFNMLEYDAIQYVPILRETWVLAFHGRLQSAREKTGQQTPFFMLPALGGGSSLRGYSSWRFRDQHGLLLQGEWRIMVNRYLDLAFFYDTGMVAPRVSDLSLSGFSDDVGVGVRFHGPFATPLRVELAKSREGLVFVFSSNAPF